MSNLANKNIEGVYKIKIKKNRVAIIADGRYISAKCHPDDKFDLEKGLSLCVERLNREIEVGDKVMFVDKGSHETMPEFYPAVGTFGIIKEVCGDGTLCIHWDEDSVRYNDMYASESMFSVSYNQ